MVRQKEKKRPGAFFSAVLLMALVFLAFGASAQAKARSDVQDYAQLFSENEAAGIANLASDIARDMAFHVFVLTADDTRGMSSRDYLEQMYEEMGYPEEDAKGGIAFFIDMDNRELNLVTQGDAIYYITDSREESVYDAGFGYARQGSYGQAMYAMLKAAQQFFASGIPDGQYVYDTETGRVTRHRSLRGWEWALSACGSLAAAAAVCLGARHRYRTVQRYAYEMDGKADFQVRHRQDLLVNQFETARRIEDPPPPPQNGGGDAGRTTVHRSSGGNTYGGGNGREF